ncbi:MAG: PilT/PilU family type 4a pilus ATPase [Pseudomonadota bacterium]
MTTAVAAHAAPLDLDELLRGAFKVGASDIHFRVDQTPRYRINGELRSFEIPPLGASQMAAIAAALVGEERLRRLPQHQELEFALLRPGLGRFRVALFHENARLAISMRVIPLEIPDLKALRLPPVLRRVAEFNRGLVLITGATGMGKSTTAASLLALIAESSARHIVTIEDPIEYVIPSRVGTVTQREVGRDTLSFADGLRASLRQDPNVLFVGELRDRDTIAITLQAAESGHLVLATFHTSDTISTISRLVGMYPTEEQQPLRLRLSEMLAMTVSQKLLPRAKGPGRVMAAEVMVSAPSTVEAIRDPSKLRNMDSYIASGRFDHGMQCFDQHLVELLEGELITFETARAAASRPADFVRSLQFTR